MIISLSGMPGAGKTTVAEILAKKLKFKSYYMGGIRREMAKRRGMTLQEYNKLGETDSSTDVEVDQYQEELGKKEDNFVIQGRTSFKFIPHSIKVFLDVSFDEGAKRIWQDVKHRKGNRNEGKFASFDDFKKGLHERMASDTKRYKKYYSLDAYDQSHYDIVIDTTHKTPEQVADEIITFVGNFK